MINVLIYILFFLYISSSMLAVGIQSSIVAFPMFFIFLLRNNFRKFLIDVVIKTKESLLLFLFFCIYATLLSYIKGADELTWLFIGIKNIFFFFPMGILFTFIFCEKEKSPDDALKNIIKAIFLIGSIQSMFVVASVFNHDFRSLINIIVESRGNILSDSQIRFKGFSDSGGFIVSLFMSVTSLCGYYLILNTKKYTMTIVYSILLFISLFAIPFVGRTGIITFLIGYLLISMNNMNNIIKLKTLGSIIALIAPILIILVFYQENIYFFNKRIHAYAFEFLINYENTGTFRTHSTDDLKSMYFMPKLSTFLFGSGSFDLAMNGEPRSDSGYLKTLLSGGILLFIFIYTFFTSALIRLVKKLYNNKLKFFVFTIMFIYLLAETKGPTFYQDQLCRIVWILFVLSMIIDRYGTQKTLYYNKPY